MRCTSYCTAEGYDLRNILLAFDSLNGRFIDQVVFLSENEKEIFVFPYGCVVFWGFTLSEEYEWLEKIKSFEQKPHYRSAEESIFKYGENTEIHEEEDLITLESSDPLVKLSFSHALSQSVKLDIFESNIYKTIDATRHLPVELAKKGKISLSRRKISQQIGQLFAERNSINLHSDILDQPEFFWKRPRYLPYYEMASEYMDINTRLDILNKKLSVVHELYEILSNELKHAHSSFLEMIIIGLIVIEVVLTLFKDILKWL